MKIILEMDRFQEAGRERRGRPSITSRKRAHRTFAAGRPALLFLALLLHIIGPGLGVPEVEGAATIAAGPARQQFTDPHEAAEAATEWLIEVHQNADGGFSSFSGGAGLAPSDVSGTLDALMAIGDEAKILSFLEGHAGDLEAYALTDGSTAGKAILALAHAGQAPDDFASINLISLLNSQLSTSGQYGVDNAFNQSLAILALSRVGEEVPESALSWLLGLQSDDPEVVGSWDDGFGTAGNADATAMAVSALAAGGRGRSDPAIVAALDFLARSQLESAGWEYGLGFGENANSTALVIQALVTVGEDVTSPSSPWVKDGLTPLDSLLSWQSESGAFQADFGEGRFDDFFATIQALPAVKASAQSMTAEVESEAAFAGGDSVLPYWLIGIMVVLLAGGVYLIRSGRR